MMPAGLLVAGFIAAILATGNSFIRKQIALKESRRVVRIFLMMGLLTLVVPLLLLLPQSCLSWRAIVLLLPPKVETVRTAGQRFQYEEACEPDLSVGSGRCTVGGTKKCCRLWRVPRN